MTDTPPDLPTGVRRVLAATDAWTARDAAEDLLGLGEPGDPAYEVWNDLIDIYEHGEVSTQAAWSVLRAACAQWLVLDGAGRRAFEHRALGRDLDDLLAEQGHRRGPQPDRAVTTPWRGRWDEVSRHVSNVEVTGSAYMAAVGVLQVLADEPVQGVLGVAAHEDDLTALARRWRSSPADRDEVDRTLLELLRSLSPATVPPLLDEEACASVTTTLRRAGYRGEVRALFPSPGEELVVVLPPDALAELDTDALERDLGTTVGRRARLLDPDDRRTVRLGWAPHRQSVAGSSSP
ncbi:hypothetical protein QE364_003187 [Nocardioides zeae]|uniref:Uncharacterized protein n=1 Tax=Nocardioides zeae TaxID=1457234 RepID=A0ACC6ILD3_9ACTN|nr:hypothetical protein [Nocardioides zeae]MDR6173982.1 hypothetical protein [Nocardioides zeae]MDR6211463.1 hypothetical protein [Nocardioides zeae]